MTPDNGHLLEPESREVAARLAARPWAEEVYLAGSAALALYVGQRSVRDLDLMSAANRLAGPERRDLLADLIELDPEVRVETARDGFLYVRLSSGVAVRLFYYPYPLIEPEERFAGLSVASLPDIGLMKIAAIISRGTRRDFVDLYLLAQAVSLDELLDRSIDKFGHVRDFPLQALKGLADLSLVQGEPMPNLETGLLWDTVEAWFRSEVGRLGREVVGLEPQTP